MAEKSHCLENATLSVTWHARPAAPGRVTLRDLRTGRAWGPVPLLAFEVCNRMEERFERSRDLKVMLVEAGEQELHLVLRDAARGVTAGIWLRLTESGELSIVVPPAEIEEAKDQLYRLAAVEILPQLLQAGPDGTLLVPVNTGMLCTPADKPRLADRFLIYGEQTRWELVPMIPLCGVQTPTGGLLALATQGADDMYCDVRTDGHGTGSVGLYPMFRQTWVDPVDWTEREVRIQPLSAGDDLTLTAARRLRRHVREDLGKATLRDRAAESPAAAYQQQAYTMKLFHGIQRQGIMMYGHENGPNELLFRRTLSFRDAEAGLRRLKAAGLDRVYLQSVGWNPKGHDGAWPTDFPIDRRLGGESGLRALIDTAKGQGYQITTHLNFGMACFASPNFEPEWVIHDLWGTPKVTGDWGGGIHGTHWGLALPEDRVEGRLRALQRLGFNGMQYLDFQGNPLYLNHHPRHRGPRRDFAAGIRRYQQAARRVFGAVEIEAGFLYCVTEADAVSAPYYNAFHPWQVGRPEWPVNALLDRPVPVWQLALHDLVTQEQHGVGWREAMHGVLFGRVMRDEWSAEAGVMPVLDDARLARLKAIYDLVTIRFGHLVTEELTDWRHLAEGVEQTRFADGTEVVADFPARQLRVNGVEVAMPPALGD